MTIIFGMGMPTTASYVIAAALGASSLIQLGLNPLAAHLFILYFAVMSNITPPVAIAAYAGANIAESDPMKTGFEAFFVAMAGYLVPFMFVFNPVLVLQNATAMEIVWSALTAVIGVTLMAAGLQKYLLVEIKNIMRVVVLACSVLLIHPSVVTDVVGFALIAFILLTQIRVKKAQKLA